MPTDSSSPDEITPEELYLNRRSIMKAGAAAASFLATGWAYRMLNQTGVDKIERHSTDEADAITGYAHATPEGIARGFNLEERVTSYERATGYNNFYEFTTDKESVAYRAKDFVPRPWKVNVGGLVQKPQEFDIDELMQTIPLEERIYRMRCVEAWSMVVPWIGFQLSKLLERVEPLPNAKFVAFETLHNPKVFPGQRRAVLDWPYVEGLRLDEAMHPLTIIAVGLYGRLLPGQNGAPLRLVVPWKYGFKGIKSIVKITLTDKRPPCSWNEMAPGEYGFYANVNPTVPHPRWSQATEKRLGELGRRPTLMFNGYGEQVAGLYQGMDLRENY